MTKGIYFTGNSTEPSRAPRAVRVLIVDDEVDTVLTLTTLLQDEGFEVRSANSGEKALRALEAFDPEAVLLDIALPGISGWETARRIRKEYGDARPLLIGITGKYKHGSDKILGEMAGFNHYLPKPYDPNALVRLLAPLTQPR